VQNLDFAKFHEEKRELILKKTEFSLKTTRQAREYISFGKLIELKLKFFKKYPKVFE